MLQASVAMGAGLLLFLPTFNALNYSYVENVAPPPWMPTPEEIPDDFEPPDDWTPPEGWEPPEGDYEIPPEWMEKYKGKIPPGGCPSPAIRKLDAVTYNGRLPASSGPLPQGQPYEHELPFDLHETTVGFRIYVNFTQWRADEVSASLVDPNGSEAWGDGQTGSSRGAPTPLDSNTNREVALSYEEIVDPNQGNRIAPGRWTLTLAAEDSYGGQVKSEGYVALACGGLLAR